MYSMYIPGPAIDATGVGGGGGGGGGISNGKT